MNLIKSLWDGDVPLWKTFWIFGVLISILSQLLFQWILFALISITPFLVIFISILGAVFGIIYSIFIWVAIWRSASKYLGSKAWSHLAKLMVLISISASLYTGYLMLTRDTDDPGKDSSNIESQLSYDPDYPLVGFWKNDCSNAFGLAIDKVEDGFYSVSFCGPGGCFKPGTYRPHTLIYGDPDYKVISTELIEVNGADGFSTYQKCSK